MTALGVYQHHDAVTGTAKQAVADDYATSLYKAMEALKVKVGGSLVEIVKDSFGIHLGNLIPCRSTNGTFLECPTSGFDGTFTVAAVQSTNFNNTYAIIKAPHGKYKIEIYKEGEFENYTKNASAICSPHRLGN